MGLKGELVKIESLCDEQKDRMFFLMDLFYENIKIKNFYTDLEEKDWILLLNDEWSQIQGFTTIKVHTLSVQNQIVDVIYSGDTIIHKDFWGELELPRLWIRSVYSLVKDTGNNSYWLLISKGYKTYRFLPVYYKTFYPCKDERTPPFDQAIMDEFCKLKFPKQYDPSSGLVIMDGNKDYLKEGIADISEKHLEDSHIKFFLSKNPGYFHGNELVCLTQICKANIKPFGLRYLRGL